MAPTAVKPKVIIVGAGIGGLVLAILLEQAGVPYEILERATVVRPLGSALALGVNVMPFFKQAGLYDEIMGIGKVFNELVVFNENREPVIQRDLRSEVEMYRQNKPIQRLSALPVPSRLSVHKMNPAGGQGAVTAMHDAIILANWINAIPSTSVNDIEMAFREYKEERFLNAVASFKSCQSAGKILEKNMIAAAARFVLKMIPSWVWNTALQPVHKKIIENRPQVAFLPLTEDLGTVPPAYQPSLHRTLSVR
ncbi:hypothetical protein KVV02_006919 [Mortierella alpina]|uniref:FAD-binding domain-containing protein n=1 Tax=Mortierella alpina TaxID=64518 RepID=A0A9P8A073_MORAP|nr:hypothetical protein KVV02_006919 [Mortierella alpina]